MARRLRLVVVGLAGSLALVFAGSVVWRWAHVEGRVPALALGRDGVIFIITDNVRADHTGLCGYDRPTTPTLSALAVEEGAVHTCRAYAPGSWTLPSHASYFTGKGVLEHGAHEYIGNVDDPQGTGIVSHKLKSELPTLAETMGGSGYQTVLLAGNPVVGKGTGLARGYQHTRIARRFGDLQHAEMTEELTEILRTKLDPLGGPLFLTVNLAEAHRPWKGVPRGHAYLPFRARMQFKNEPETEEWPSFLMGTMGERKKRRFLDQIEDTYDYGIERADDGVRAILRVVRNEGWCRGRCRIVITSDHGEFIGEHGLIDHGFYSWEENAGVYLLALGTEETSLPSPISALAAYSLVRDGRLPAVLPAVEQMAWPHMRRSIHTRGMAFSSMSVARWTEWTKQMWMDGNFFHFDLRVDRHETSPTEGWLDADFAALAERVEAAGHSADDQDLDVMEALKAAGYEE